MAIASAWHRHTAWQPGAVEVVAAVAETGQSEQLWGSGESLSPAAHFAASGREEGYSSGPDLEEYLIGLAVVLTAEMEEVVQSPTKGPAEQFNTGSDIWEDSDTLYYIKEQCYKPEWSQAVRARVRRRGSMYVRGLDQVLRRRLPDGSTRIVPKPADRKGIVIEHHHRTGHYGVRRTGALVGYTYWWHGLWADVAAELSKCGVCERVRSTFSTTQPTLQPLPISGLMYRWGVDLCGPFEETTRGNLYTMVAVEHYSKHLELVPLPNKEPATTAAAMAASVLGRYGSPAEVLTDRGGEWHKEFQQLMLDCMIDHRHTSAQHPAANGLTERAVGTVKRALAKLCAEQHSQVEWDLHLPWLMLGYNASPQKSTGFAPFQLMHGLNPVVPPAIRERIEQPFEFADNDTVAADFLARSMLIKHRLIIAGENLEVAQHRDTLRFAKRRSGYIPQLRRFLVGDFVYVKRKQKEGLDILAKQLILRVAEVRPTGVLILQGRCGTKRAVHAGHCAPCHLPNVDPTIDPSLRPGPAEAVCEKCDTDDVAAKGLLIFCDNCNGGWHLSCHDPVLPAVPKGTWVCSECEGQGITKVMVEGLQQDGDARAAEQLQREKLTAYELRARDVDGRYLRKCFTKDLQGNAVAQWYWGQAHFRGRSPDGNLIIAYEDGDTEVTTLLKLKNSKAEWQAPDAQPPAGLNFMTAAEAEEVYKTRQAGFLVNQLARAGRPRQQQVQAPAGRNRGAHTGPPAMRTRAQARTQQQAAIASVTPAYNYTTSTSLLGTVTAGTPLLLTNGTLSLYSLAPVSASPRLPQDWDLHSQAGVLRALQTLMPGDLHNKDASRISQWIAESAEDYEQGGFPGKGFVPTLQAEVQALLNTLDFSSCSTFHDPFAGSGTIAATFATAGFQVTQNDLNPKWSCATAADALQPCYYHLPQQVIVCSPPFDVLDIAVPLAAMYAGVAACIHVPGHWVTNPRVPRQLWLQHLYEQGRVHTIMGLPRGPMHKRCVWLVIFRSAVKKQALMRRLDSCWTASFAGY
jgi:hypothetical protein